MVFVSVPIPIRVWTVLRKCVLVTAAVTDTAGWACATAQRDGWPLIVVFHCVIVRVTANVARAMACVSATRAGLVTNVTGGHVPMTALVMGSVRTERAFVTQARVGATARRIAPVK
jgi:hypothetical protein